jgi:hypothetical protein
MSKFVKLNDQQLVELDDGEKSSWIDEVIIALAGIVCAALFIVSGVMAWLVFEYDIQSVLRAAQEHFFG